MKIFPFCEVFRNAGASKEAQRRKLGGPLSAANLSGAGFDVFLADGDVKHCV